MKKVNNLLQQLRYLMGHSIKDRSLKVLATFYDYIIEQDPC